MEDSLTQEVEPTTEDSRPAAVTSPALGIPIMRRRPRRLRTRREGGAVRVPAAGTSARRTGSKERPVAAPSRISLQSSSSVTPVSRLSAASGSPSAIASRATGARAESVGKKAISPGAGMSSAPFLTLAASDRDAASPMGRACQMTSPAVMSSSSIAGR